MTALHFFFCKTKTDWHTAHSSGLMCDHPTISQYIYYLWLPDDSLLQLYCQSGDEAGNQKTDQFTQN